MGFGSVNTPGAWIVRVKNQLKEVLARIGSMEKTLGGAEKIPGTSAPTAQTNAEVGQIYIDVTTGEEWKCIAVSGSGTSWEKQAKSSVGLTAEDVGASPKGHKHTKSEITDFPASMPASDVAAWAKAAQKPSYTASEVGAISKSGGNLSLGSTEILFGTEVKSVTGVIMMITDPETGKTHLEYCPLASLSKYVKLTAADVGAAEAIHGTHVSYSATTPVMDGTASVGSADTVARSDHRHPTDTTRAAADHPHTAAAVGAKASDWKPFHAGTSAPSDTTQLWIDTTANSGGLKYHNGLAWVAVPVAYT